MRVIQVVNVRWFNATAWYGLYQGRLLAEAGHEVLAVGLPNTPPMHTARRWGLRTRELDLNTANPLRLAPLAARMWRLVEEFRPHVVNCHRGEAFALWALMRRGAGYRLVRTRGDRRLPRDNPANRWLYRHAADAVAATNREMYDHLRDAMGVPEDRLWYAPGAVDTETFRFDPAGREEIRAEFGFPPEDFVVGLLGRFDRVKGQEELIRAVSRLTYESGMERLRLFFIGHDSALPAAQIHQWLDQAGMAGFSAISGRRDDLAACISALDLGVAPSLWSEAIARAALEIMACDRPLVASRTGVLPDLLPEEALAEPGDVEALAGLIRRAATDPDFTARLRADHARRLAYLTPEVFLAQTLRMFGGGEA
jgi:glycosyltransferase involved in cell wall biosynthesis